MSDIIDRFTTAIEAAAIPQVADLFDTDAAPDATVPHSRHGVLRGGRWDSALMAEMADANAVHA